MKPHLLQRVGWNQPSQALVRVGSHLAGYHP